LTAGVALAKPASQRRRNSNETVNNRGFTLIELMIVSAVLAILAMIALPKFGNLVDRSREAAMKGILGSLRSALTIYSADNEGLLPRVRFIGPNFGRGMYHLHGKYIDLSQMRFHLPRYVYIDAGMGVQSSRDVLSLYDPSAGGIYQLYNYDGTGLPGPSIHTGAPYPSYYSYHPNAWDPVLAADIAMYPSDASGGDLMDLSGRVWSQW
jgi:prepilin-type N-terminal cleavage/methylation domain-containing protein